MTTHERYTNSLPERRGNLLSIPLLGFQGLVYGTRKKADLFVDTLEDSFQENITPYDDDHIDKVDRTPHLIHRKNLRKILLKELKNTPWTIASSQTSNTDSGKKSPCHQLLRATNIIISGFNNHATTGGIFLDVEKAFDRLWHNGLIFKMINLNYPPYLIHTISDYLHNRTLQVKIQATISKIGHIQAGSPQGSLLSPILYNIYTYDFPTSPLVDICLFADDAAILSQHDTPQKVRASLQKYLKKLKKWLVTCSSKMSKRQLSIKEKNLILQEMDKGVKKLFLRFF
ncbi:RNA-directed DNA polymerase from mobile element jockey [Trichonephila clavipes]|nr:RNA-directed DNA polymerase from mobile element jockey [Trichonephila clavipes]